MSVWSEDAQSELDAQSEEGQLETRTLAQSFGCWLRGAQHSSNSRIKVLAQRCTALVQHCCARLLAHDLRSVVDES